MYYSLLSMALQPSAGYDPIDIRGFLITHNDAPQSVGLLWASDQLVAETSTWQHTTHTTDKHPFPWWNSNPRSQQASGRRPTPYTARPLGPAIYYLTLRNVDKVLNKNYSSFSWSWNKISLFLLLQGTCSLSHQIWRTMETDAGSRH
jgi:hypothetical protein